MNSKKKVLLLFNGPHLAYSPTALQLYTELSKQYDVTIIAQNPNDYSGQKPNIANVLYHKYYNVKGRKFYNLKFKLLSGILPELKLFKRKGLSYRDYYFKYTFIKNHLRKNNYYRIISNDIINLYFCTLLQLKSDFLSLELTLDEHLLPSINFVLINCVLIQSPERYDYLFKQKKLPVFFVQNAPVYKLMPISESRKGILFAGAAYDELGFYHCLEFLNEYPSETMTVQGAVLLKDKEAIFSKYKNLLESKSLILNTSYLDDESLLKYINQFEIGFCFYNFKNATVKARFFNYATAPSGKMFKYLAAGVPVVAIDIIGFKFVNEFNCGVLIKSLNAKEIMDAILTIRRNYNTFCTNAIQAAQYFSFDKRIALYVEFINQ